MRLATIRTATGTRAARVDGDRAVVLDAADVGAVLAQPDWRAHTEAAGGERAAVAELDFAPLVLRPDKIVCVGLNYRQHILEMGRELPEYPALFAKYRSSLIGAYDEIILPAASSMVDWEAELAVVIGDTIRHASPAQARGAIAGYSVLNDVSVRDWQYRTLQWLQGKTFEATTPLGPFLVTLDELPGDDLDITCEVNGTLMQHANTTDLLFGPAALVSYVSSILTLERGDVIATGTPGGVGHARTPPQFLEEGDVVVTRIAGIGECRNACRRAKLEEV